MIEEFSTDVAAERSDVPTARVRIWIGLLVLWTGWGSVYAAMATSAETIPPLLATGIRFMLAGALLGGFGARRGLPAGPVTRRYWHSASVLGVLCILLGTGGIVVSVKYVPSGTVALLAATAPLWVALVEWVWLRRRVGGRTTVGLVLGFLGTALLVTQSGGGSVDLFWAGVVVLCSGAWALGTVYAATAPQYPRSGVATGMQMLLGGAMVFALSSVTGELDGFEPSSVSTGSLLAWGWMLVMGALAGYGVCMWLLRVTSPTLVATANYVNPVVAVVIGWALLDEQLTVRTLVSGVLVVAGVALIVMAPARSLITPEH